VVFRTVRPEDRPSRCCRGEEVLAWITIDGPLALLKKKERTNHGRRGKKGLSTSMWNIQLAQTQKGEERGRNENEKTE